MALPQLVGTSRDLQRFDRENKNKSHPECIIRFTMDEIDKQIGDGRKAFFSTEGYFVRNLPWYLWIVRNTTLNVFLLCNKGSSCDQWSCLAKVEFKILSQRPHVESISQHIERIFDCTTTIQNLERTESFAAFEWDFLLNYENGYLKHNAIYLEVHIEADVPFGVFCDPWNSRLYTGYAGLKKRDDNSWMNCIFQIMYFTTELRRAVYKIQTWGADPTACVPLGLQRMFYDLAFRQQTVDGSDVLAGVNFFETEMFEKHKFMKFLLEELESNMKDTSVKETIPDLFRGCMTLHTTGKTEQGGWCIASKEFEFHELQLDVKNIANVIESLKIYLLTHKEHNDCLRDHFTLRNLETRLYFSKLPPILHLYLKRFEKDLSSNTYMKISGNFEFYERISLNDFLRNPNPIANYTLYAVLVYQGEVTTGKHVAFIDPKVDGQWHKFEDDIVCRCTKEQAIDDNYGGQNSTACLLVYIRDIELHRILEDQAETLDQANDVTASPQIGNKLETYSEYLIKENKELVCLNILMEKSRDSMAEQVKAEKLEVTGLRKRNAELEAKVKKLRRSK